MPYIFNWILFILLHNNWSGFKFPFEELNFLEIERNNNQKERKKERLRRNSLFQDLFIKNDCSNIIKIANRFINRSLIKDEKDKSNKFLLF